jgi:hypothetical protein
MKSTLDLPSAQAERLRDEAVWLELTPEDFARPALCRPAGKPRRRFQENRRASAVEEQGIVSPPRLMRYLTLER